jgi:translation initiation factor IF-2
MAKIRIYEIAKQLNLTSKEVLARLAELGIEAKTHSSSVTEDVIERLKGLMGGEAEVKGKEAVSGEPEKEAMKEQAEVRPTEPGETTEATEKEKKAVVEEEDEEIMVPDRFRSQLKEATQEKFRVKSGMQRAFDTIRRVDVTKKRHDFRHGYRRPFKKPQAKKAEAGVTATVPTQPRKRVLKFREGTTVKEFAELIGQKVPEVIKKFMELGIMTTINQPVDIDAAQIVAESFGVTIEPVQVETEEELIDEDKLDTANLRPRPPIVTIMGHVDHGKTTLLDAIRKTRVTETEAGGITQHIGAYKVKLKDKEITFLDTPGHEAFTMMRARGAKVTDIVILVVAADDGVMPQTIEAIDHAKAANVPIIVAINKIDKPEANVEKVKSELSQHGIVPEEWGGQNIFVEISAKKNIGIENLLEMILLQAEIMELKADYDRPARGTVIESKLDRGRGPVATVLVNNGTLRQGDPFIVGTIAGRVRSLIDENGKRVNEALPSTPVEVIGFPEVPQAGDIFVVVQDEKRARQIAMSRLQKQKTAAMATQRKLTLDELYSRIKEGEIKELNIIIKADVQGSVEAVRDALEGIKHPEVKVRVIHAGVGGINESDVMLASASNAIVIGFNVRSDPKASSIAEREGVDIRLYSIIYEAIDDVKKALEGLLEPTITEKVLGRAEVRQTFHISKVGTVAGCYVLDGVVTRASSGVRVIRDNVVIYESKIASLKRFKDDVKEVQAGFECGLLVENFNDIKVGDIIEVYQKEEVAARLT